MARTLLLVCMLACSATLALAADRILPTVSGSCKDTFNRIIKEQYADDKECASLIQTAMSTAPKTDADCPGGAQAGPGSRVQKCMAKNQKSTSEWVTFIKNCEILNVNERTGAGEAESAATPKPSCFPRFNSLSQFQQYMGATSSASSTRVGGALIVAAAATLYLVL